MPLTIVSSRVDRVLSLERIWTAAVRAATGNAFRRSLFTSPAPWKSMDATQRRRWEIADRLTALLETWGADPKEFCTAAMEYFRKLHRPFQPNMTIVSGPVGKQVWESWRCKRLEEAGGYDERRVRGAAYLGTRSEERALLDTLTQAYQESRAEGTDWALVLSPTCPPEIAWVLCVSEPAARATFRWKLGSGEADDAEFTEMKRQWQAGVEAIRRWPAERQRWLRRLRDRVAGTAAPVLQRTVGGSS